MITTAGIWRDKRGNFAAITAIALVPIMAGVVGVIDIANQENQSNNVQNALDAAGIGIATKVGSGMTDDELANYGNSIFQANIGDGYPLNVQFDYPGTERPVDPLTGKADGDTYITVTAELEYASAFSLGLDRTVNKITEVTLEASDASCVLALNGTANNSVHVKGDAEIDLDGCNIASNSTSPSSIYRQGSAQIDAACIRTKGGTAGTSASDGTTDPNVNLECSAEQTAVSEIENPLAGYAAPKAGFCANVSDFKTGSSKGVSTYELEAGKTYCENLSGQIILKSGGTYIFDAASISLLNDKDSLTGTGVTLVFLNGGTITANGGTINLSAPTDLSDPYAGIVIYSGEGNTKSMSLGGNASIGLTGFVYMPDGDFEMGGTSGVSTNKCLRLLANTITLSGTTGMKSDCETELAGLEITSPGTIRIKR